MSLGVFSRRHNANTFNANELVDHEVLQSPKCMSLGVFCQPLIHRHNANTFNANDLVDAMKCCKVQNVCHLVLGVFSRRQTTPRRSNFNSRCQMSAESLFHRYFDNAKTF